MARGATPRGHIQVFHKKGGIQLLPKVGENWMKSSIPKD